MIFLFGLAIAISAHLAMAQVSAPAFMTGNDLLADCDGGNIYGEGVCLGYIEGVIDTMFGVRTLAGKGPCPPGGGHISGKQVEDIVVNALKVNQAKRNLAAASLVLDAVSDAWHCR